MKRMKKYFWALALLVVVGLFVFAFSPLTVTTKRGWKVARIGFQSAGDVDRSLLNTLETGSEDEDKQLPTCPETPPRLLGPRNINLSLDLSLEDVVFAYPNVQLGGHFKPFECVARQRIAVIIPFRRRETHLNIWLFYMHQFLQRQEGDYTIYVIEQHGDQRFNRAKLMNVGFTEAQKHYDHNCFVFSDVDIVPIDDRNYYRCYNNPRHMANALDKFNYRVFAAGMRVERPNSVFARSRMIPHERDPGNEPNQKNIKLFQFARMNMHTDGLSSLKVNAVNVTRHLLYTKISVDIGKPEDE